MIRQLLNICRRTKQSRSSNLYSTSVEQYRRFIVKSDKAENV
jgi:hypothetical protein